MTVVLFSQEPDWHARHIIDAFSHRLVDVQIVALDDCIFDAQAPHGLVIPGFGDHLPTAACVRCIGSGSLEEITFRLSVLHALETLSVRVVNRPGSIERSVDKSLCSFELNQAGLPSAPTWSGTNRSEAMRFLDSHSQGDNKVVLKPLFGSQGKGLLLLESIHDLPPLSTVNGVAYLQQFIPPMEHHYIDWRAFVVGDTVAAVMERRSTHWRVNIHQGGQGRLIKPSPEMENLALSASRIVGTDYAGVDIMRNNHGQWIVTEVNAIPAFKGLYQAGCKDIAGQIADHCINLWRG